MTYLDYTFQTYNHLLVYLVAKNFDSFGVADVYGWLANEKYITFWETLHIVRDLTECGLLEHSLDVSLKEDSVKDIKELEEIIAKYRFNIKKGELYDLLNSVPFEEFCSNENEFKMLKRIGVGLLTRFPTPEPGMSTRGIAEEGISIDEIKAYLQKLEEFGCIKISEEDTKFPEFVFLQRITNKYYKGLRSLADAISLMTEEHSSEIEHY